MSFSRPTLQPLLVAVLTLFAAPALADDGVCTLADHIRSANTNTAVGYCPAGTSHDVITITEDLTLSAALPAITGTITIEGGGHTISGDNLFRIFDVSGGNLTIKNLTLTAGKSQSGGAIRLLAGARLALRNATFRENWGYRGGVISSLSAGAEIAVMNSRFVDNLADQEAGVFYLQGGSLSVRDSSFLNNRAEFAWGGVFYAQNARLGIVNSTFVGNQSLAGGVLSALSGESSLTHVTMIDNKSYYLGGDAIYRHGGSVALRNSIVSNRGPIEDCTGGLTQESGNLSADGSCSAALTADLMLEYKASEPDHYGLRDGSPALDAALAEFCPAADQLGTPRPQGSGCDIGAIESLDAIPAQADSPPVCPLADQIVAANTDTAVGNCPAGDGADTLHLVRDITLGEPLPRVMSDITIEGAGHIISGGGRFRIFRVDGGTLRLNNLTLTKGRARDERGGAITVQGGGTLIVNDSVFTKNSAKEGGAIWVGSPDSAATVHNSAFIGNRADNLGAGGAIDLQYGVVTVLGGSFVDNVSSKIGGAIATWSQGELTVSNSTFSGNSADEGGAIFSGGARVNLTHVTMVNNRAEGKGGGAIGQTDVYPTQVKLRNSIVLGDIDSQALCGGGELQESAGNLIGDSSCGASAVSGDAALAELTGLPAYFPLRAGSGAIDAALPDFCPAEDQIGASRPQGGGCDIGAIEFQTSGSLAGSTAEGLTVADCRVTTTHGLNFRDGPNGDRIGVVPQGTRLGVIGRTSLWFKVEYGGATGWISADYVDMEGDCG